jgi:hypothetical protein
VGICLSGRNRNDEEAIRSGALNFAWRDEAYRRAWKDVAPARDILVWWCCLAGAMVSRGLEKLAGAPDRISVRDCPPIKIKATSVVVFRQTHAALFKGAGNTVSIEISMIYLIFLIY